MIDTIYALSSGAPPAAIAIVRISGPRADAALEALAGTLPEPRRAVLVALRRGEELLDRALALRFPGPGSATGEDAVELHVHGGRAVVAAILRALSEFDGLREAEPGEFTRRAFQNGRLDLTEAEGLADLLTAETEAQRRAALALAGGALSRRVEEWRQALLTLAADVEAVLDFSDEGEVGEALPARFGVRTLAVANDMRALLTRVPAERLRDGIRIVIAGPPNAGKSSLFNVLAGRDAAITSDIPGTTRDLVEAPTAIEGMPFLLIDTAGMREAGDEIEAIGIERARGSIAGADLVLWLGSPCEAPARSIVVHSKSDIAPPPPIAEIAVSAKTGAGIGDLVARIVASARLMLPREGEFAANARQRFSIAEAATFLHEAETELDPLLVAEHLRLACASLDRVTGRAGVEDMLDILFGRFCVGK